MPKCSYCKYAVSGFECETCETCWECVGKDYSCEECHPPRGPAPPPDLECEVCSPSCYDAKVLHCGCAVCEYEGGWNKVWIDGNYVGYACDGCWGMHPYDD